MAERGHRSSHRRISSLAQFIIAGMLIFSMTALSAPPARAESVPDCIVGT
ncbi:MAG: hypothetical protein QOF51_2996, partial [Chloroflexota bacterium]|nr:hypothetical protein [Chloroflexota bacterium]